MKYKEKIIGDCRLILGDCLDVMPLIDFADICITDPPYGTTNCKWDSVIPFPPLWENLLRIVKSDGAIVMTACQPFTTTLISSNIDMFRYTWVYQKTTPSGHLNANKMPLRAHEDIVVFYQCLPTYNPQKTRGHERKVTLAKHKKSNTSPIYKEHGPTSYDSTERYPISVQCFSTDRQKSKLNSTQKPVALMDYLIKTYTNPGETVLDYAMGSATCGVACINTGRKYIGIENDEESFDTACRRLDEATKQQDLFKT